MEAPKRAKQKKISVQAKFFTGAWWKYKQHHFNQEIMPPVLIQ